MIVKTFVFQKRNQIKTYLFFLFPGTPPPPIRTPAADHPGADPDPGRRSPRRRSGPRPPITPAPIPDPGRRSPAHRPAQKKAQKIPKTCPSMFISARPLHRRAVPGAPGNKPRNGSSGLFLIVFCFFVVFIKSQN
jgi:hypothetical protein